MIKKIARLVLIFVFSFLVFDTVHAYSCKYEGDGWKATVKVDKTYGVTSNVSFENKSTGKKVGSAEPILNWARPVGGFSGGSYQMAGKCPELLMFFNCDQFIGSRDELYVASSDSKSSVISAVKAGEATGSECKVNSGYPKVLKITKQPNNNEEPVVESPNSCNEFHQRPVSGAKEGTAGYYSCTQNPYFSCLWIETDTGGYCNVDKLQYVTCGDATDIPKEAPNIIGFLVNLLKIATPIILIVISIITLLKALVASKEDELKKAQKSLITKIIAAVLIFFVTSIVQFVVLKVADSTEVNGISDCLSCFLNNDCNTTTYYKFNVNGDYYCRTLVGEFIDCETGKKIQ